MSLLDRAYGALIGGAIGDAMGMPLSFFTRKQIRETYGFVEDFLAPSQDQTYHGDLEAASITDDTMEGLLLARVLMESPTFQPERFIQEMKRWALDSDILSTTLIGPSTRRFLEAIVAGDSPQEGAKLSRTNGSAMRVAPVGVRFQGDLDLCVKTAAQTSRPSHSSKPCMAAACAVAAAVAAGVAGGHSPSDIVDLAARAAFYGEEAGTDLAAPSVARRILLARDIVDQYKPDGLDVVLDALGDILGAGMEAFQSIPFSLGVFYAVQGRAREGILQAINGGDDADTNGSICGNLCGAYSGASALPPSWIQRVKTSSGVDFQALARGLLSQKA